MLLSEFLAVFDFVLAQAMNLFTLLDTVVIVEDPRFTFFSFLISVIFLILVVSVFRWLLNSPGHIRKIRASEENARESRIKENLQEVNRQMAGFREEEDYRFLNEYTNMRGVKRNIYRRK